MFRGRRQGAFKYQFNVHVHDVTLRDGVAADAWFHLMMKKGDRVAIYMPMVNELVVAMLACARIGAVHSIVFGGYRDKLYKKGLPGKSILEDYFQENRTSRRSYLLLRISFPGGPIFIQLPPGWLLTIIRLVRRHYFLGRIV